MQTRITPSTRLTLALAAFAVAGLATSTASAQPIEAGVNATPMAMILLDTSGSMEWLDNEDEYPVCLGSAADYASRASLCADDADCGTGMFCDGTTGRCAFSRSRYHTAVEVLTGTIPNYYAYCDDRSSDPDRVDQIPLVSPDQGVRHSIACSSSGAIGASILNECYRDVTGTIIEPRNFRQLDDGLIDLYGSFIHFGFMAFDSFPEESPLVNGMYSYGQTGTSGSPGLAPAPCIGPNCWNLGARRPGAGVEGGAVAPIDPRRDTSQRRDQINQDVEDSILGVVPYWSTPIGAMLEDALTFYTGRNEAGDYSWYRQTNPGGTDAGTADYSRGLTDPYEECRPRYAILITDGLPTYDACVRRGSETSADPWDTGCEGYWYGDAEYYATQLLAAGVTTYVVGFNVTVDDPADVSPLERLQRIAEAGCPPGEEGCGMVYFADGSRQLLFQLGDILSQIAQGTPSRTRPATTTQVSDDRRGLYRFTASFSIREDSKYWAGNLDRIARECDPSGQLQPPGAATTMSASERLDARPFSGPRARRIFTTSPQWHSCHAVQSPGPDDESLFNSSGFQAFDDLLDPATGVTPAEAQAECVSGREDACLDLRTSGGEHNTTLTESNATLRDACLVEVTPALGDVYPPLFGAGNETEAEVNLRWLMGQNLGEIRAAVGDPVDDLVPPNFEYDAALGRYERDRVSRLADIYHSAPAIIGPPNQLVSREEDYQAFAQDHADRRTMVYVGTNDGLLHAFDADTLEEEWAFLPSSFSPRIAEWISTGHSFMFDGSPVVGNLAVDRRDEGGIIRTDWRTVLVAGYRAGGRGFVAMDVTDPEQPRFLWELDSTVDPQLGYTYGEPTFGTVLMSECVDDRSVSCERGIAVLPGGRAPVGADDGTNIGHLLYVVDVETGAVLRRFTEVYDMDGRKVPVPAEISGSAALFDTIGGALATRGFIGDAEGRLLRLDLSSGDPADWRLDIFFDPAVEIDDRQTYGEVVFRPTIAIDQGYRAVVVYGTGDVDDLDDLGDTKNYVFSLTEQYRLEGDTRIVTSSLNWATELEEYEKLTARPRIFNRRAYFATFVPNAVDLCQIGGARLYNFHYIGEEFVPNGYVGEANCSDLDCQFTQDPTDPVPTAANPEVPYWDASNFASEPAASRAIPEQAIIHSVDVIRAATCFATEEFDSGLRGGSDASGRITSVDEGEYRLQIGSSFYDAGDPDADGVPNEPASAVRDVAVTGGQARAIPTSWTVIFE